VIDDEKNQNQKTNKKELREKNQNQKTNKKNYAKLQLGHTKKNIPSLL
jgi:hypothetical protein